MPRLEVTTSPSPAEATGPIQLTVESLNTGWLRLKSVILPKQHTESTRFVQRVGATFLIRVFLTVIGILTSIMIARLLGPEGRGIYAAAIVLGTIASQFGNLGMHTSNTYYVAKDQSLLPVLISNSLAASFLVGGAVSVALLLLFTMRPALSPVSGTVLYLVMGLAPALLGSLLAQNLLLGIHQVKWFNLVDLAGRIWFVLTCAAWALRFHTVTTEQVVAMTLASTLVTLVLAVGRLLFIAQRLPRPELALLVEHFSYGVRPYLSSLAAYAVLKIDVLMVKNMAGSAATGYYSLASNMTDLLYMFPTVVCMMLFPSLLNIQDFAQRWYRAQKILTGVLCIMSLIALSAALVAKPLVALVYGEQYLPSVPPFLVLCCAIVFYGATSVISNYFASCGQPWFSVWIWPAAAILNVGLNLYCIPRWGIVGAATSSLLTYSALFVTQYTYAHRYVKRHSAPNGAVLVGFSPSLSTTDLAGPQSTGGS